MAEYLDRLEVEDLYNWSEIRQTFYLSELIRSNDPSKLPGYIFGAAFVDVETALGGTEKMNTVCSVILRILRAMTAHINSVWAPLNGIRPNPPVLQEFISYLDKILKAFPEMVFGKFPSRALEYFKDKIDIWYRINKLPEFLRPEEKWTIRWSRVNDESAVMSGMREACQNRLKNESLANKYIAATLQRMMAFLVDVFLYICLESFTFQVTRRGIRFIAPDSFYSYRHILRGQTTDHSYARAPLSSGSLQKRKANAMSPDEASKPSGSGTPASSELPKAPPRFPNTASPPTKKPRVDAQLTTSQDVVSKAIVLSTSTKEATESTQKATAFTMKVAPKFDFCLKKLDKVSVSNSSASFEMREEVPATTSSERVTSRPIKTNPLMEPISPASTEDEREEEVTTERDEDDDRAAANSVNIDPGTSRNEESSNELESPLVELDPSESDPYRAKTMIAPRNIKQLIESPARSTSPDSARYAFRVKAEPETTHRLENIQQVQENENRQNDEDQVPTENDGSEKEHHEDTGSGEVDDNEVAAAAISMDRIPKVESLAPDDHPRSSSPPILPGATTGETMEITNPAELSPASSSKQHDTANSTMDEWSSSVELIKADRNVPLIYILWFQEMVTISRQLRVLVDVHAAHQIVAYNTDDIEDEFSTSLVSMTSDQKLALMYKLGLRLLVTEIRQLRRMSEVAREA